MDNRPLSYVGQGEFQLLKMMAEEIERGEYRPGSAFTPESQLYVFRRFRKLFGPLYSDRFLKSRFKNLKKRYHEFSALLNHEGIHWDKENNLVCGNEELLQELCKRRYRRGGGYNGEKHFDLMCQVFESGVHFW